MLICIDGVAPLAKIIQQRKRRYLTIFKNKLDKIDVKWDTNAISCGTVFMKNLDNYLQTKIKDNHLNFILDGSCNNGEGEHKIFTHLNNLLNKDENKKEKAIVINGLDADLIILSLLSGISNIYLMRENNDNIIYVNINNLKKSLLEELKPKWTLLNENEIIESYCVMCSILGNDFIPHITTLNMKNNGLNKLIDITTKAINSNGALVSVNKINKDCLSAIFTLIAENEDIDINEEVSAFIKKKPSSSVINSNEYGLKNKDNLINDIYNNNRKWRYYYYKSLFDININYDSSLISTIVASFIKGIYWTYNYYKRFDLDYEWFYPFNYPPTTKDISNYLSVNEINEIKKNGSFLLAKVQLLLILPIQSNHLLSFDKEIQSLMTDNKKGFIHLFPKEFKIQTFLKTQLHECGPILPMINIEKITKINKIN
jgi:5'-3' exonuclease